MKYTYLDYLSEDLLRYKKTLGWLVFIFIFSFIILVILVNHDDLKTSNSTQGEVTEIRMDTVSKRSEALYASHYNQVPELVIIMDNETFVMGSQYTDYRTQLLEDVEVGDVLKVYYELADENSYRPLQIERFGKILFPISYFETKRTYALFVTIGVNVLALLIIVFLWLKRKRHLKL